MRKHVFRFALPVWIRPDGILHRTYRAIAARRFDLLLFLGFLIQRLQVAEAEHDADDDEKPHLLSPSLTIGLMKRHVFMAGFEPPFICDPAIRNLAKIEDYKTAAEHIQNNRGLPGPDCRGSKPGRDRF